MGDSGWPRGLGRGGVSTQLLDRLLEHNPAIVYTCTVGRLWTFSYVSPNVRRVLGFEASEFLTDPGLWLSRLHPTDRPRLPERAAVDLLADGSRVWEYRFRHRDGTYRWLQNEVRLLPDADPMREPFECTGYCIDISERKKAEAAWRDSEARFEAFMKNSPAIAFLKDEDGRLLYMNPAFTQGVGLAPASWQGRTDAELWPPHMAMPIRASDLEVLTTGVPKAVEEVYPGPQGDRVFFSLKFPLRDAAGRTLLAGMGVDATERRLLQQRFVNKRSESGDSETKTAPALKEPDHSLPKGTETVLLIEDEFLVRDLAKRLLSQQGYRVLEAASGVEALSVLEQCGTCDLLLTDVVMPGLGGREVVDRIRVQRPNIRVVFMSGYSDSSIFDIGHMAPHETFVHKPFSPLDLLRTVREILDGHALRKPNTTRF